MKITVTNDGVKGVDAITVFKREDEMTTENHHCIEGGESWTGNWEYGDKVRFELVPWLRIPPTA